MGVVFDECSLAADAFGIPERVVFMFRCGHLVSLVLGVRGNSRLGKVRVCAFFFVPEMSRSYFSEIDVGAVERVHGRIACVVRGFLVQKTCRVGGRLKIIPCLDDSFTGLIT